MPPRANFQTFAGSLKAQSIDSPRPLGGRLEITTDRGRVAQRSRKAFVAREPADLIEAHTVREP